jgi:hypothetical protein
MDRLAAHLRAGAVLVRAGPSGPRSTAALAELRFQVCSTRYHTHNAKMFAMEKAASDKKQRRILSRGVGSPASASASTGGTSSSSSSS